MNFLNHDRIHYTAGKLVDDLQTAGIALPAEVTTARERLAGLMDRSTQPDRRNDVAAAVAEGDMDRAREVMLASIADERLVAYLTGARQTAGGMVYGAISEEAEAIVKELGKKARPHIATVKKAGDLLAGGLANVTEAVRAGRMDDAHVLVEADAAAAALQNLLKLRKRVTLQRIHYGEAHDLLPIIRNVEDVTIPHDSDSTPGGVYGAAAACGGVLWWPTIAELEEAGKVIADARVERLKAERPSGGMVAFG